MTFNKTDVHFRSLESVYAHLKRNMFLLQEDHLAGMQAQKNILPPSSWGVKDFSFSFYSKPALYMSGDFVDYFAIDDNFVAFYLADAAGHGVSSAFITILLKFIAIRHLHEGGQQSLNVYQPHEVLAYINRILLLMKLGKHITMIAGLIDIKNNVLTYSIGGHLPLPVIYFGDSCAYLNGKGMPIGMFENAIYSMQQVDLPSNFSITLFSDGILDLIEGDNLRIKEANLLKIIAQTKGDLNKLVTHFNLHKLNYIVDDITILSLHHK